MGQIFAESGGLPVSLDASALLALSVKAKSEAMGQVKILPFIIKEACLVE
ncbi:MAG: hypothetical protein ACI965_000090 [Paraglaciecola sp.]|jgi:hypothetical protein